MTTFVDGPAAGVTLALQRSPLFLRVTFDESNRCQTGPWDALDEIDDTPAADEVLHCYRRIGKPARVHLYFGGSRGGWYASARYELFEPQPMDSVMRRKLSWQGWCLVTARSTPAT